MWCISKKKRFHQFELIPIGHNDKKAFKELMKEIKECHNATHWLVGIVSCQEAVGWRAVVFPAKNKDIAWDLENPIFETLSPTTLKRSENAFDVFSNFAKCDKLFSESLFPSIASVL